MLVGLGGAKQVHLLQLQLHACSVAGTWRLPDGKPKLEKSLIFKGSIFYTRFIRHFSLSHRMYNSNSTELSLHSIPYTGKKAAASANI